MAPSRLHRQTVITFCEKGRKSHLDWDPEVSDVVAHIMHINEISCCRQVGVDLEDLQVDLEAESSEVVPAINTYLQTVHMENNFGMRCIFKLLFNSPHPPTIIGVQFTLKELMIVAAQYVYLLFIMQFRLSNTIVRNIRLFVLLIVDNDIFYSILVCIFISRVNSGYEINPLVWMITCLFFLKTFKFPPG